MRRRAAITSVGRFVPERILSNHDLEAMVDTSDEWIMERTGIRERRIAAAGTGTSELAAAAAQEALDRRGIGPNDIDLIIVGTITPDMMFPSTACLVQDKLGATRAWGFDLSAACCGLPPTTASRPGIRDWAGIKFAGSVRPFRSWLA